MNMGMDFGMDFNNMGGFSGGTSKSVSSSTIIKFFFKQEWEESDGNQNHDD